MLRYHRRTNFAISLPRKCAQKLLYKLVKRTILKQAELHLIDETLVPCNDIDLIWRAHRLHPSAYEEDFIRLTGSSPPNGHSSKFGQIGLSATKTKQLWKEVFNQVRFADPLLLWDQYCKKIPQYPSGNAAKVKWIFLFITDLSHNFEIEIIIHLLFTTFFSRTSSQVKCSKLN